jgi:hypothetical protein
MRLSRDKTAGAYPALETLMRIHSALVFSSLTLVSGVALAQSTETAAGTESSLVGDPGYAPSFRCPESYPDEASRRSATTAYLNWAREAHPGWRVEQTLNYRAALLQANQCQQTIDDMVTNPPQIPSD